MKKLFEFEFLSNSKTLYWAWLEATKDANEEEMKNAFYEYLAELKKNTPYYVIVNERDLGFAYVPKFQEWINQEIFPIALQAGVIKFAVVKNTDFILSLAIEQTFEEENAKKFEVKFFHTPEEAKNWTKRQYEVLSLSL